MESRIRGGYAAIAPDAANHLLESIERAARLTAVLSVYMAAIETAQPSLAVRR